MSHITNRKHASPAQCGLATATLLTGLALAAPAAAAPDLAAAGQATTLDGVQVNGVLGYKAERMASPKFTQPLQDTPQTIQVITAELFNQQGATTLAEALRNSPGVGTFYAGENGNTATGDAVYMRGFDSSNSIYVDGVRDLGSISRDVFNTGQVEVTKGPAGTDNGRSSPTGAINMVSKHANLHDATSATPSAGDQGQKRATADWNHAFAGLPGTALRVNAMWQDSDVPGRDHVDNQRHGLATSLAFGLGSDTRYYLNLLYVEQDNVPDGFVPTIGLPGWEPQPGLEALVGHPVDPENFYGTGDDHDEVTAQMATFRVEHDFSDTLKLSNTLRWGQTVQDYLLSAFMTTGGNAADPQAGNIGWTNPADLSSYTVARSLPTFKDQRNRILTNQLNLRADFATGGVQHNLSTGLELTREEQHSHAIASTGAQPAASLYAPDWNDRGDLAWARSGAGSQGRTDTAALYLFDTLEFGERFLLSAGLRLDRYETSYRNSATCGGSGRRAVPCGGQPVGTIVQTVDTEDSDTLLTWKLGGVYKPSAAVSLYAGYALSQQPPGGANFQLSDAAGSANSVNADPQKARTLEVGTKWSLLEDALALNLALFRTDVSNEINTLVTDDAGLPTQTGQKRVQGMELSLVGNLTANWSVSAGYTHQDTEVEEGAPVARNGSHNLTYTPEEAFTGWTTYRFASGLTLGGGVRYSGRMLRGTDGAAGTPESVKSHTVWDAVASYAVNQHLLLRLNGYNLFDKQYVASINKSGYRYTPGVARTVLLSAELRF